MHLEEQLKWETIFSQLTTEEQQGQMILSVI